MGMEVKLDDKIGNVIKALGGGEVRIGVFGGTHDGSSDSIASIAAQHEFGTQKVPQRSFILASLLHEKDKIEKAAHSQVERAMREGNADPILKAIGIAGEGAVQEGFDTEGWGNWLPTVRQQYEPGAKILVLTGQLRQAIASKVDK